MYPDFIYSFFSNKRTMVEYVEALKTRRLVCKPFALLNVTGGITYSIGQNLFNFQRSQIPMFPVFAYLRFPQMYYQNYDIHFLCIIADVSAMITLGFPRVIYGKKQKKITILDPFRTSQVCFKQLEFVYFLFPTNLLLSSMERRKGTNRKRVWNPVDLWMLRSHKNFPE